MQNLTRRSFIYKGSLLAGVTALSAGRVMGSNEAVRLAIVGMGWWSAKHVQGFARTKNARIVAFCDVDRVRLNEAAVQHESIVGKVDLEVDYRRLLDREDIDAVVLATPNHWHALQTIWACQAGKDVYVEKPCSHTIWEGQQMIRAARRYDRIVQVGLQSRSAEALPEVAAWIREGNIGAIQAIHGIWYQKREPIGQRAVPMTPPKSVDYNLWLGPAQDLPLYRDEFHYDWHWKWNTGNGELGNLGSHTADIARLFLGNPKIQGEVISLGRRFVWDDAGETPNMQLAAYQLGGVPVIHEVNNFPISPERKASPVFKGSRQGVVVLCEGGYFVGHNSGKVFNLEGKPIRSFSGGENHRQNFIDAVISRRRADLNAEMERGFESCKLPLLANIAHLTGEPTAADSIMEQIAGNPPLQSAFERFHAQGERLGFDYSEEPWILGSGLNFDSERQRFTGGDPRVPVANSMLKRESYREPFVVPDKV